jgi:methionyl-tRNA formyltransferase
MTHDNNSSAISAQRRLVIFTSDCLVAHMHLNDILPFLKAHNIKPVIFMMPDTKSPRAQIPSLKRFSFYEEGILNDVIYPTLEAKEGRAQRLTPTFNQMARDYGFTATAVEKQTDPAIMAALDAPGVIGALSVYHDVIFKAPLINAVKEKGFFWNLHPAVLPQNQGLYLAFWNMVHGKPKHGCTLHEIDEGIDTGRIIATAQGRLNYSKPVIGQYFDFVKGGSELIKKALLQQIRLGGVSYKAVEPHTETAYRSFPTEDDISAAARSGVRMIGTPEEMVGIYTAIFGNRALLRDKILNAIFDYEAENQGETPAVSIPAAMLAQRQNDRRRTASLGLS